MRTMAKHRRYDYDNRILHVVGRSVHTDVLFPDPDFSRMFWNELGNRSLEFGVDILAICLLGNHYHLLVRGKPGPLADTMHRTLSKLANTRNHRHDRRGALVGRRYQVLPVKDPAHAHRVIRYVPMNPVHHGLTLDPAKWRWSTHSILIGKRPAPEWFDRAAALRAFGFPDARAYNRFVLQGTPLELPPMTPSELKQHRVLVLAQHGLGVSQISDLIGYSPRHVRRLIGMDAAALQQA